MKRGTFKKSTFQQAVEFARKRQKSPLRRTKLAKTGKQKISNSKRNINSRKLYNRNIEHYREYQKNWRQGMRNRIIDYYSNGKNECACCGEKTILFLTIDHLNNDGSKERRLFEKRNGASGGHHNYRRIIKNNFPEGYQILCYNCNCGRARTINKICPHKL